MGQYVVKFFGLDIVINLLVIYYMTNYFIDDKLDLVKL